jgi:hypothetical protein
LSKNKPTINTQILDNPHKDGPRTSSKESIFRREYKDPRAHGKYIFGKGPYFHAARTIHHDDICTDEIAEKLANRVWMRKNLALSPTLWEITVSLPVPVPLDFTGMQVRLKDFTRKVNGEEITIPGGDYFLRKVDYKIGYKPSKGSIVLDFNETLTLGSQL